MGLVWVAIDSHNGNTPTFTPKAQLCDAEVFTWVAPVFELPELPTEAEEMIPCPDGYQSL
ncbi:MAG: hypothetical protein F6K09_01555 [Merismopedia sp. SIO2A8]|nr:hypothetical protein [Merismopedia sp. SIO2A8]